MMFSSISIEQGLSLWCPQRPRPRVALFAPIYPITLFVIIVVFLIFPSRHLTFPCLFCFWDNYPSSSLMYTEGLIIHPLFSLGKTKCYAPHPRVSTLTFLLSEKIGITSPPLWRRPCRTLNFSNMARIFGTLMLCIDFFPDCNAY